MRDKKTMQETTGSNKNVAQSFFQNIIIDSKISPSKPFTFERPMFNSTGGSKEYYGQELSSIFYKHSETIYRV